MYLSLNLLKEFLPEVQNETIESLENKLNSIGIEVEQVITFPKINGLQVGEIKEVTKPQEGARVNLCSVLINNKIKKIICGGTNVACNKKVIVANVGTKFPDGKVIEKKKLMGVVSEGMICGYGELNNLFYFLPNDEKDHIILLDDNATINDNDPFKYVGLDDTILDLSIPSNRNDLNGLFWLINELCPFYNKVFNVPKSRQNNSNLCYRLLKKNAPKDFFIINFDVKDFKLSWKVKYILMNNGIVPTNTIEDIASVSQVLIGVPIFGFDSTNIKELYFDNLANKTSLMINNTRISLEKGTPVLRTKNEIVLVNGIGVNDKYKIINESLNVSFFSCINDIKIINKIINNNIVFPKSKLSSKEISPALINCAYTNLMHNLKIKFSKCHSILKISKQNPKIIKLNFQNINNILSTKLSKEKILLILKKYGYKILANGVQVPENRIDVENEMDVIEDVLKIYGINNIAINPIINSKLEMYDNFENDLINNIKNYLVSLGFYNIKTYNLCSKNINDGMNYFSYKTPIRVENPISIDREYMRFSLLNGIVNTYSHNSRSKNDLHPVFEIQDVYHDGKKTKHIALAIPRDMFFNSVNNSKLANDIFVLKNIIINIFLLNNLQIKFACKVNFDFACVNDSLNILFNGKKIGYITRLNPKLLKEFKINENTIYYCEAIIDDLLLKKENDFLINNYHDVQRLTKELTFTVTKDFDLNDVYNILENQKLFENYQIISCYENNNEISYSIRFDIIDQSNVQQSFESIINYFNINKLIIKDK